MVFVDAILGPRIDVFKNIWLKESSKYPYLSDLDFNSMGWLLSKNMKTTNYLK